MAQLNQQTSRFLDVARGMAALAVLIAHAQVHVLVNMSSIPAENRGAFAAIAYVLYGFGHQAVVVFFVLSGFLVGGKVVAEAAGREPFLRRYLIDRTVRIYTVLVPALVLTLLLDHLGRTLFGQTGIYDLPDHNFGSGLGNFAANLLNLQNIFVQPFGTDFPLWSLAHEYWYYVTFGLIMVWFSRAYSAGARWAALCVAIALTAILSSTFSFHLFGFVLWLAGVAAARLPRALMRPMPALLLFLAAIVGQRVGVPYAMLKNLLVGGTVDLVVTLTFANLLLALRFDDGPVWGFSGWRIHTYMAQFSFSLYAVHMPIMIFLCAAAQQNLGMGWLSVPTSAAHWGLLVAIIATILVCARLFWSVTEAHAIAVRTLARRLLVPREASVIRPA